MENTRCAAGVGKTKKPKSGFRIGSGAQEPGICCWCARHNEHSYGSVRAASLRRLRIPALLFHFFSQAQWSHVSPDLFNIIKTFGFCSPLARVSPSKGVIPLGWPDRVLLLMVDDDLIDGHILFLVPIHSAFLYLPVVRLI